jgi:hypothetical protein
MLKILAASFNPPLEPCLVVNDDWKAISRVNQMFYHGDFINNKKRFNMVLSLIIRKV